MNKQLSFMASVFLASFALSIAGAGAAYADDDDPDGDEFADTLDNCPDDYNPASRMLMET